MKEHWHPVSRSTDPCGVVGQHKISKNLARVLAEQKPASKRAQPPRKNRITLYIGEVTASKLPVILDTLLGSCVAVCIYDPVLRAGGMNHILLPNCRAGDETPRIGINAMELLINEVMKLGGDRRRFVAKAFGGANVLGGIFMPQIGDGNARFVRDFLATERIPLLAERMGGDHAVHLYFWTDTGKATVHTVDGSILPRIIDAERRYWKPSFPSKGFGGEITIF